VPDETARFRKQAEECREQAEKATSPLDKEAWPRVADEWLKVAMTAEKQTLILNRAKLGSGSVLLRQSSRLENGRSANAPRTLDRKSYVPSMQK
jgi:hypothetical protein